MQRIGLVMTIGLAIILGVIAASSNPYLGILVLMIILLLAVFQVPVASQRLYLLVLAILAIGLLLSVSIWEPLRQAIGVDPPVIYTVGAFLLALGSGILAGAMIVLTPLMIMVWIAALWVCFISADLNLGTRAISGHLFRLLLGINPAFAIVEGAQVTVSRPAGLLPSLGGGILIIRPGTAVVTEYGGGIRHVLGPGIHRTIVFEQTRHLIDLTPQQNDLVFQNIRTADGTPLSGVLRIRYQITPNQVDPQPGFTLDPSIPPTIDGPHPLQRHALARCVYQSNGNDWRQQTRNEVLSQLSLIVGQSHLLEIFDNPTAPTFPATGFQVLAAQIQTIADEAAEQWAVQITQVQLLHVTAPEELVSNAVTPWQVNRETQLDGREQQARQTYTAQQIAYQAQLQQNLINFQSSLSEAGMPAPDQARMINLLDRVLATVSQNRHTAFRYFQILEALSRHPDTKVVLVPDDKGSPITL